MSNKDDTYKGQNDQMSQSGNQQGNMSTPTFRAQEFRALIANNGKTTVGGKEYILKSPSTTDTNLRSIVNDPNCSVKTIGAQAQNGDINFELSANGKTTKVT